LIISAEEFSQLFIESRSFSFDDLSTNWIGMILGYFSAKAITLFRTSRSRA
ncbi:VanZ family protein, partial [Vibrio parahaemolyticus]|nr:VanZ family protein [Vibrio parahaemolyticus]